VSIRAQIKVSPTYGFIGKLGQKIVASFDEDRMWYTFLLRHLLSFHDDTPLDAFEKKKEPVADCECLSCRQSNIPSHMNSQKSSGKKKTFSIRDIS